MRTPRNKYANHAVDFINNLSLTGDYSGEPFILRKWQEQIIRLIFGQQHQNKRLIEHVFLMLPTSNGKTELCAAVAIYCLLTFPPGQEIYSAGCDSNQAALIFNSARQMIENDPVLLDVIGGEDSIIPSQKRIVFPNKHSVYCALAADAKRRQGYKPSVVLFDEIHTQKNADLWNVLSTKLAKRSNPLWIGITTAGPVSDDHIAKQEYEYARKIQGRIENGEWIEEGSINNPNYLSVLYYSDEEQECLCGKCDEGWQCEKVWKKVNPALGDFKNLKIMRDQYEKVLEIPSRQAHWRREHLNTWMGQASQWLDMSAYDECAVPVDPDELIGKECWAGLDLAPVHDLSCFSLLFNVSGSWKVLTYSWCNEAEVKQRTADGVPYDQWMREGWLEATPGSSTDFPTIRKGIVDLSKKYRINLLSTDPQQAYQLGQELSEDYGMNVQWHGQGFKDMSPPMQHLEKLIIDRQIHFGKNPVTRFCFDNTVVVTNSYGSVRPDHDKANEKMDATVSVIMAIGGMLANPEPKESIYEQRGVFIV